VPRRLGVVARATAAARVAEVVNGRGRGEGESAIDSGPMDSLMVYGTLEQPRELKVGREEGNPGPLEDRRRHNMVRAHSRGASVGCDQEGVRL